MKAVLLTKKSNQLTIILIRPILMGLCANREEHKVTKKDSMESTAQKPTHGNNESRISRKSTLRSKSPKINEQYQLKQALNRYFDQYDKDGDDHLTVDEIQQFLIGIGKVKTDSKHSTNELANIIMDKLDKDGDGTVSRSEFYHFYKNVKNH